MPDANYERLVDAIMVCVDEVLEKHEVTGNVLQDMDCSCGQSLRFQTISIGKDPSFQEHLSEEIRKALKEKK